MDFFIVIGFNNGIDGRSNCICW